MARAIARISLDGYLTDTGWLRSASSGTVVDARGDPVPWATLPFVAFIAPRLRKEWRVFEYGAGASTLFYAARVADVLAVEHDAEFARKLALQLPKNARVEVHAQGSPRYFEAIAAMSAAPHVVSIDGRGRVNCAAAALQYVAADGVIVFDDSERVEYEPAMERIAQAGYRRLDFWGVSVGSELHRCTTVFYRPDNVLGI